MPTQDQTPISQRSLESRFPVDYQDHAGTRYENDRRLLPVSDDIASGKNIENLERFAKAYLGMYLDMDNAIPPADRIYILANPELAKLVLAGFAAVLKNRQFASSEDIVESIYSKHLAEGYILLAALHLFSDEKENDIKDLPANTLIAAICFSYAYKHELPEPWLRSVLLNRPEEAIQAFNGLWQRLILHNSEHLPGIYFIIRNPDYDHIAKFVLLPVLQKWLSVRKKLLRDLLRCALRTVDPEKLYKLCESSLRDWNAAEPGRYMLWLGCAFLLQPEINQSKLSEYAGRSKEKLIPLLDFTYWVLHTDQLTLPNLKANAYATLIRIIAAKITPQKDRYGELCDNTRKVLFLFYGLACSADKNTAIKQLLKVRVIKLYKPILEYIAEQPVSATDKPLSSQLDDFIDILGQRALIQLRIKWSD